ncbi:ArsR family transcriptional regulator [Streptomyces halobius]|uniref:ArsR family transcriptional regulator n=1 Tax=Streptomyces halobius TaxID=2879846 RepID=UPI00200F6DB2
MRLRLVQAVIQGPCTVRELSALDGTGTSGQLYHHLRLLTDAGWLHSPHRGQYAITEERGKRVLLAIAAAKH